MRILWQDLRYGARMLLKNPGFTLSAVLTLALGIGLNTVIFSIVNVLWLRPLAVAQPERLVGIGDRLSLPNYRDLSEGTQAFTSLAGHAMSQFNLGEGEESRKVFGELVTASYFSTLGVSPALGRTFGTAADEGAAAAPVAVVSHGLWRQHFESDRGLVGRTIVLNGYRLTVIGVMPEGFHGTWPLGWA
ncbi:MAG TPA: ABC transporter permease, partial [Blastocatellia bacterium]|nr:ABC transporter permease [Blastocatellia bacterium]